MERLLEERAAAIHHGRLIRFGPMLLTTERQATIPAQTSTPQGNPPPMLDISRLRGKLGPTSGGFPPDSPPRVNCSLSLKVRTAMSRTVRLRAGLELGGDWAFRFQLDRVVQNTLAFGAAGGAASLSWPASLDLRLQLASRQTRLQNRPSVYF